MRFFIRLLALLYIFIGFSQTKDTVYFDKYWNKTVKDKAFFYRPIPLKKQGDLYVIKDYFVGGRIQMEGFSLSVDKDVFEGKAIWYYESGQQMLVRRFSNGKLVGKETSYFRDGTLLSSGFYEEGRKVEGSFYLSSTAQDKSATFVDGQLAAYNTFYETTKTVARQTVYGKDRIYEKSVYFDKNGDTIAVAKEYNRESRNLPGASKAYLRTNKNANVEAIIGIKYHEFKDGVLTILLKDALGNVWAKGFYKGDNPYDGRFFQDNRLVTYNKGVLEGEAVFYDQRFNEISRGTYSQGTEHSGSFYIPASQEIQEFEDGKIIAKITKNKFTDERYKCTFEGYTPINGDYYTFSELESYKNGKRIKRIDFDYDTGNKKSETYYENGDYQITKVIFHKNGQQNELIYKDGIPFKGKEIQDFGFTTYKDGETKGPFVIEDLRVAVKGNYTKGFKKDGEIRYVRKKLGDTLSCVFKNGEPIQGTTYELNNLISYKGGKKEGCSYKTFNNRRFVYDSLRICYEADLPVGTARYFFKDSLVAEAHYKNGKPFNGTFFDFYNKTIYADGKVIEKAMLSGFDFKKRQIFKNEKLVKEIFRDYATDTLKYTMEYIDGRPNNGTQIRYDSVNRLFIERKLQKGKKEGVETIWKYLYEDFLSQYTYKRDKKNGLAKFNVKFSDTTFQANYKDDKPINGVVIAHGPDFITKSIFKETKLLSKTFYTTYSQNYITTITYKHGKPYSGSELIYDDKKRTVKKYTNGTLVSTYLGASRFTEPEEPNAIYKVYHYALMDSVVSQRSFNSLDYHIRYTSKSKKSGTISFFKNDTLQGNAAFKNHLITTFNYKAMKKDSGMETINLVGKKLEYNFNQDD
ncbi:MAG: hypothetical protein AAFO99_02965, partial [Bacteroidota bacterium]